MANKKKELTDYEKEYIRDNYNCKSTRKISRDLGLTPYIIKMYMSENCLFISEKIPRTIRDCDYTLADELYIKENYLTMSYRDMALFMNKSESAIGCKISSMMLSLKSDKWTEEDINTLKVTYPYYPNSYIAKEFLPKRSSDSINVKANEMHLIKHGRYRFAKEDLKTRLILFSKELGRTPTTYEIDQRMDIPSSITYARYFNSYSEACIECGLVTNRCLFGKYSINELADDNKTICLSNAEIIITNFLISKNIKFEKEKRYSSIFGKDLGMLRCDWYLTDFDVLVEYFGLANKEFYKAKMNNKIDICNELNKELVYMTSSRITLDLLNDKFKKFM